ncbi:MAG: AtpZ/AtpI family protein [Deltaproteobacteria bacterium]|nr:AtpZ/AtpI family protein [Deltaproteobacteria bacterium]
MKIPLRDAGAISIGIELVVSVMLGLGVGVWLDRRFATGPWLTLVGIVVGSAAGFRSLLRFANKAQRREEQESALEDSHKVSERSNGAPDEDGR